MGYAQYGTHDGFPIINAHGGLACRLDVAAAAPVATELGVRLISFPPTGRGSGCPIRNPAAPYWIGRTMSPICSTRWAWTGSR